MIRKGQRRDDLYEAVPAAYTRWRDRGKDPDRRQTKLLPQTPLYKDRTTQERPL
jgi:hypothetical protein